MVHFIPYSIPAIRDTHCHPLELAVVSKPIPTLKVSPWRDREFLVIWQLCHGILSTDALQSERGNCCVLKIFVEIYLRMVEYFAKFVTLKTKYLY